jgi:hypothetical protein
LAHQFTTLKQYIRSLPQWYRRLLANYEQLATDQKHLNRTPLDTREI